MNNPPVGRTRRVFSKTMADLTEAYPENMIKISSANPNTSRVMVLCDSTVGFTVKIQ
jgi:hypothetical protein